MKSKLLKPSATSAVIAIALCCGPLAQAQQNQGAQQSQTPRATTTGDRAPGQYGQQTAGTRASATDAHRDHKTADDLTGRNIRNAAGENIGELSDLVIDGQSGQILFGVVSSGGFLGIGDTKRVVPFKALTPAADDHFTLNVDAQQWETAPRFADNELATLGQGDRARQIYQHYGQTWDATRSAIGQSARQAVGQEGAQARRLMLSSNIEGKDIRQGGDKVGEIEDVLVSTQNHRASALIELEGRFADTGARGDQKYVVGFNQLMPAANIDDGFTTTLAATDFQNAQPLTGDSMSATGDRPYVWTGFGSRAVGVDRTGTTATSDTGAMRPGGTTAERAAERPANPPVAAVRNALRTGDDNIRDAMRQVNVLEENGRLVLRGFVDSQQHKQLIEQRAAQAAQGWEINNEIAVRSPAE